MLYIPSDSQYLTWEGDGVALIDIYKHTGTVFSELYFTQKDSLQ